jgi:hypothetical protein
LSGRMTVSPNKKNPRDIDWISWINVGGVLAID